MVEYSEVVCEEFTKAWKEQQKTPEIQLTSYAV